VNRGDVPPPLNRAAPAHVRSIEYVVSAAAPKEEARREKKDLPRHVESSTDPELPPGIVEDAS